jgi:hypothetical protein
VRSLLLALLLAGGCKPGSWNEFSSRALDVSCTRDVTCGAIGASETHGCTTPLMLKTIAEAHPGLEMGLANALYAFDADGAQSCLDAMGRAACDSERRSLETVLYCHNVVRPAVPQGGACSEDAHCLGGRCEAGHCVAFAPPGAACVREGGDAPHSCDPTVHFCSDALRCERHKQENESCADAAECSFGLTCLEGVCHFWPRARLGESCTALPCITEAYCAPDGNCAPLHDRDEACELPLSCKPGDACLGLDAGRVGVCAPWLDRGAACMTAQVTGCPATEQCMGGTCR